eukprot:TRINITY_DN7007_c0_g2_i2.p1 TRINITY_DN7007_c0_g2~~TRINITY_DN7007_c0_g2_i2.p1  ORF type:complete len:455 (+),score=46.71 TRINITY_DN7007_c0_g2_i2:172-1536(+)
MIGNIFFIKQFWDGITDPLIGILSDRTRTRIGRKRPWILFSILPLFIFWSLLWFNPTFIKSIPSMIGYVSIVLFIYSLCKTLYLIPYQALFLDQATSTKQKSKLATYYSAAYVISFAVSTYIWASALDFFQSLGISEDYSYFINGLIFITIASIIEFIVGITCYELKDAPKPKSTETTLRNIKKSFKELFNLISFPPYILIILFIFFLQGSVQFNYNLTVLWSDYIVFIPSKNIILIEQIAKIFSVLIIGGTSYFIGNYKTLIIFLILHSFGLAYKFTLSSENELYTIYIALFINGLFSAVITVIPTSLLAESVNLFQLKYDYHVEGIAYSIRALSLKVGFAFAQLIVTYSLDITGYTPPDSTKSSSSSSSEVHQLNESTLFIIRFLSTFGIIIAYFIAAILITIYTLYVKYRCKDLTSISEQNQDDKSNYSDEEYNKNTNEEDEQSRLIEKHI